MIRNFKAETLEALKDYGKTWQDVKWVGTIEKRIPKNVFLKSASLGYYQGDIIIVGKNWWLERNEYDGNEWWEIKQYPKMPEMVKDECVYKNDYGVYVIGKKVPKVLTEDEQLERELRYGKG